MNPRSLLLFGHAALALINTPIKRRLEESRGKDPPKDSATYSTKRAHSLVNNYLWLDIIIIYVKTQECEALNYLCFQGAEGGDTD